MWVAGGHLAGILFQSITDTRFQHVPYRGNALALQDLLAGQIDFTFADQSALALVRAGSVKALVVTSSERFAAAPDIPTADDAGLPGLSVASWNGIFAPKGTPEAIIGKLNDATVPNSDIKIIPNETNTNLSAMVIEPVSGS